MGSLCLSPIRLMACLQGSLSKDSANQMQYKEKGGKTFAFIAEMKPILSKDSANRMQYKAKGKKTFAFIAEMKPVLCKEHMQNKS